MPNEFTIHNCVYCGAPAPLGTKLLARVEEFTCAKCGQSGKLSDAGTWTPPPTCKEVPNPIVGPGAFALVWEAKPEAK